MKIIILSLLCWVLFCVSAFSQNAQKIDEFENTNCDEYLARMDILLTEVNKFSNAKGYVFVYEGHIKQLIYDKNGKYKGYKFVPSEVNSASELINYFKKHLLFRNYPSEKIVFIEAGFREKFTVESWLVPNGANPLKPVPTLKKIKQRKPKRNPYGFCGEM